MKLQKIRLTWHRKPFIIEAGNKNYRKEVRNDYYYSIVSLSGNGKWKGEGSLFLLVLRFGDYPIIKNFRFLIILRRNFIPYTWN